MVHSWHRGRGGKWTAAGDELATVSASFSASQAKHIVRQHKTRTRTNPASSEAIAKQTNRQVPTTNYVDPQHHSLIACYGDRTVEFDCRTESPCGATSFKTSQEVRVMRALVTGGAGFVGSHVVDALVARGADVLVVDDLSRGNVRNLESALQLGAELINQDVRSAGAIRDTMRRFDPEVVFHLAAQVSVHHSIADPVTDAEQNVVGVVSVLAAAAATGVHRVVLSSTGGAIYGESDRYPTPESATPDPPSAYGLAKWAGERYGRWFRDTRDIDVVALRYSNVYGPRQSLEGDSGVVLRFCAAALECRPPVIYGDGMQTRDFVYVDDVVEANLAAAQCDQHSFGEYNVGSGIEVTVNGLADAVRAAAGLRASAWLPHYAAARDNEVRRSCLDIARARAERILEATTTLPNGIERTLSWLRDARASLVPTV
ncbi:NAD-dependent epimerase/dehydratase family protein [Nocardia sp. NPDC055053]